MVRSSLLMSGPNLSINCSFVAWRSSCSGRHAWRRQVSGGGGTAQRPARSPGGPGAARTATQERPGSSSPLSKARLEPEAHIGDQVAPLPQHFQARPPDAEHPLPKVHPAPFLAVLPTSGRACAVPGLGALPGLAQCTDYPADLLLASTAQPGAMK
jgi:hypothetical protein